MTRLIYSRYKGLVSKLINENGYWLEHGFIDDLINQLPVDRLLRDIGIIRQRIRDLKDGGTLDEE